MKIRIKNSSIKKVMYTLMLFLIVYNPPIIKNISFTMIFCLAGGMICLLNINYIVKLLRETYIRYFIFFMIIHIIYTQLFGLINLLIGSNNASGLRANLLNNIINNVSLIVIAFFITIVMIKEKYKFDDMIQTYINVGVMQSIIACVCYFFPKIKEYLNKLMANNSGSDRISTTLLYTSEYRNYGFASTLYDIFGFTMSLLAIFALSRAINGSRKNYLYFLLIAFSAIINARTSIIILVIGYIVIMIQQNNKVTINNICRIVIMSIAMLIIMLIVSVLVTRDNSLGSSWIASGVEEIVALLTKGEAVGYFDTLFNSFIFFPNDTFALLFGCGLTPAQAIRKGSDVAYIQNLWQFGIIGSLCIYYMYFRLFQNTRKRLSNKNKSIASTLIILIAIYMIKLNCLGYGMAAVVFLPMTFFVAFEDYILSGSNK